MENLAGIVFGGTGPILVLTSYKSVDDPDFVEKLRQKGIKKYIAYEVPIDLCQKKYGQHYSVILGDLAQTDDLRVLDYNGHNIYNNFRFSEIGTPRYHEP